MHVSDQWPCLCLFVCPMASVATGGRGLLLGGRSGFDIDVDATLRSILEEEKKSMAKCNSVHYLLSNVHTVVKYQSIMMKQAVGGYFYYFFYRFSTV